MPHPSPYSYRKKLTVEDRNVVGWFSVSFKDDPNHEYTFELYEDGTILPQLDLVDVNPKDRAVFATYLADPDFHKVDFTRNSPITVEEMDVCLYGESRV